MRAQNGGGHEAGHPALDMVREVGQRKTLEGHETWRMPEGTLSCLNSLQDHACQPKPPWRILCFV